VAWISTSVARRARRGKRAWPRLRAAKDDVRREDRPARDGGKLETRARGGGVASDYDNAPTLATPVAGGELNQRIGQRERARGNRAGSPRAEAMPGNAIASHLRATRQSPARAVAASSVPHGRSDLPDGVIGPAPPRLERGVVDKRLR